MPWTPSDGPARHTKKADTPAKRQQWSAVANKVLADTGDEGRAVRIANGAVKHTMSARQERAQRRRGH